MEIYNYKCHKDTIISNCSDFHTFVGKNSSGKTSILECCQLIKQHTKEIENIKNLVYGTIAENETKEIIFRLELELSDNERRRYLNQYFGFKYIDELIAS